MNVVIKDVDESMQDDNNVLQKTLVIMLII